MKPVITKIEIDKKTQQELDGLLKLTYKHRRITEIRRLVGGLCVVCGDLPSTRVSYEVGDKEQQIERLEYYCNKCIVRLTATNGDQTIAIRKVEKNYTKGAQ